MRLIDADALKINCDIIVGNITIGRRDYVMFHEIDEAPSIDIVRCKECAVYMADKYTSGCGFCEIHHSVVEADDFCSYGERSE